MTKRALAALRGLRQSLLALAILLPIAAAAQVGFTTQAVNVRAGPDRSFPLVAWLQAGTRVNVVGCISDWRWCDVVVGFNRGWVYSRFLSVSQRNQPVIVLYGGPWLGIPVIPFSIGPYWGLHYQNRPWWNERDDWFNRPPPPAWQPPRPPPPMGRPPPRPQPPTQLPAPWPGPPTAPRPPNFGPPPGRG